MKTSLVVSLRPAAASCSLSSVFRISVTIVNGRSRQPLFGLAAPGMSLGSAALYRYCGTPLASSKILGRSRLLSVTLPSRGAKGVTGSQCFEGGEPRGRNPPQAP